MYRMIPLKLALLIGLTLLLVFCPDPSSGGNDLPAPGGLTALAVSASSISLS